ncbi:hypothetical protein IFM89_033821 [Coptis chinensis]|uniref:Uncharacterized protein n=1 Tax=Coptis chinensis TaxID=261450 RepID=A0A835HQL0_9MAGN|nr:hypothetical protein IFM89_033821 [Coptis chinensis]
MDRGSATELIAEFEEVLFLRMLILLRKSNEDMGQDEVYTLVNSTLTAGALDNIVRTFRVGIVELKLSVEELRDHHIPALHSFAAIFIVGSIRCGSLSAAALVVKDAVEKSLREYDEELNRGKTRFHALLQETQELLGGFSSADFFPWLRWIHKLDGLDTKLEKNFRQLDKFYDEVIEDHLDPKRPKPGVEDLVDVLLRLQRDPTQRNSHSLSSDQIKGVLADMFIAGTDTSSATLTWTMTELIKNPTMMKKAQGK